MYLQKHFNVVGVIICLLGSTVSDQHMAEYGMFFSILLGLLPVTLPS